MHSLCHYASELYQSADVESRNTEVVAYNKASLCKQKGKLTCTYMQGNRWRKRGLTMMPLRFGIAWNGSPYTVLVSIYADDGTVAIAHGGVEIGQGINTKVKYM